VISNIILGLPLFSSMKMSLRAWIPMPKNNGNPQDMPWPDVITKVGQLSLHQRKNQHVRVGYKDPKHKAAPFHCLVVTSHPFTKYVPTNKKTQVSNSWNLYKGYLKSLGGRKTISSSCHPSPSHILLFHFLSATEPGPFFPPL
jgi:hypothetical protein